MQQITGTSSIEKFRSACRMAVVLSGNALFFMVPMAIITALPSMAKTFTQQGSANGVFEAQLVLIVSGLSAIIGAPMMPLVAKWTGKKSALLAMLVLYVVSGGIGIFESSLVVLLIARAVLGFAGGAIAALTVALIADYYEGALRGRLLGFSTTIQMAVAILVIALCGWLVDRFRWTAAFSVYPVAGLLMFAVGVFAITEPEESRQLELPRAIQRRPLKELLPVFPAYLVILVFLIALFMGPIQGPFLLASIGVKKATVQGLLLALPNIATMIAGLTFGYLSTRFSERVIVISIAGIIGAATVAAAASNSLTEIVVCFVILGLGAGISMPLAFEMVIARASTGIRGTAVGLTLSTVGVGQFLNPAFCAPISSHFGIKGAFAGIGVFILLMMAVLFIFKFGRSERQVEPKFENSFHKKDILIGDKQ